METSILFIVNVPVLSKQIVFILDDYTVFYACVPIIFYLLNLTKQKEYAKLKKIGKGAGKLYVIKSKNLNTTIIGSISNDRSWGSVAKYMMKLIIITSNWKYISFMKNYGCFDVLFKIFRIILPLCDAYPTLTASAKVWGFIV